MTDVGQLPHCDERVLHAPGECVYCDRHPDWQALRETWGIAFSDHEPAAGQAPCPSTVRRPAATINQWGGNRALDPNAMPTPGADTPRPPHIPVG